MSIEPIMADHKDDSPTFLYYLTGDMIMDTLLKNERKDSSIEYIVIASLATREAKGHNIFTMFNELWMDIKKKQTIKVNKQNITDYTIEGRFIKGHPLFPGRKVKYTFGVDQVKQEPASLPQTVASRDFSINSICKSVYESNNRWIDYHSGLGSTDIRSLRTINTPHVTFSNRPLKLFKAFYLSISRNLNFAQNLSTYISELQYDDFFKNTNKSDIRTWLRYIYNDNPIMFKKMLGQYTNLTNYLYKNVKDWK